MLRYGATTILITLGLTVSVQGQAEKTSASVRGTGARALSFFERIEEQSFDAYLKRVRLPEVSAAFRAEALARLTKGEEVRVSDRMKDKLAALAPILKYHERESVIAVRVISAREAFVRFQARAVLLISEKALSLLSVEEFQAVVAHELGHEYFWGELMEARQQKQHETASEIELRCDGIALIALHRLGIDPANLGSALTRIRTFNARIVSTNPLYHPRPDERLRFIHAMSELIKAREAAEGMVARN
jgi:Zn-dependent protease with chaperone function